MNVTNLRRLHMHAADHDRIGPREIGDCRTRDILVDETDRPGLRQIGRKHQKSLRRHEGMHVVEQGEGVREGAEGRRVGWKDAQDLAGGLNLDRTAQSVTPESLPRRTLYIVVTMAECATVAQILPAGWVYLWHVDSRCQSSPISRSVLLPVPVCPMT